MNEKPLGSVPRQGCIDPRLLLLLHTNGPKAYHHHLGMPDSKILGTLYMKGKKTLADSLPKLNDTTCPGL